MPLGFQTLSHGEIPIGFFDIKTDMFLVHDHFVFASDLCGWICDWTVGEEDRELTYAFYVFHDPSKIGDLNGAIAGERFTGFIGELYRIHPFPKERGLFKQDPEGWKTREEVTAIVETFIKPEKVPVVISKSAGTVSIGPYVFDPTQFYEVLKYIWRGGWPRWTEDRMPDYVENMKRAVLGSGHWLFADIDETTDS